MGGRVADASGTPPLRGAPPPPAVTVGAPRSAEGGGGKVETAMSTSSVVGSDTVAGCTVDEEDGEEVDEDAAVDGLAIGDGCAVTGADDDVDAEAS